MTQDYTPVKFMIKCFEANYPESLGVVLVHKSPWIFQSKLLPLLGRPISKRKSTGIWNIIKGWLDPVVASKVHFTKNLEELEQFVEKSHIIKELGGDDPWEYQYIEPQPEENDRMSEEGTKKTLLEERAIVVKEFEAATQEWIGSNHNKPALQEKRAELAEKLRTGYWQLDPYLRARSLYDRSGMIKEGGTIEYYGEPQIASAPKPLVASQENGIPPTEHRSDDVD